jgi:hypothetical protein
MVEDELVQRLLSRCEVCMQGRRPPNLVFRIDIVHAVYRESIECVAFLKYITSMNY